MSVVDFAKKVLETSFSKPKMFQRDNRLYVVSEEGFAEITGIPKVAGQDSVESWIKEKYLRDKPVFFKNEAPYINSIAYEKNSDERSLESFANIYKKLSELPDDGRIRMVKNAVKSHELDSGGGFRHDVYLTKAESLPLKDYLDIFKNHEESSYEVFKTLISNSSLGQMLHDDYRHYKKFYDLDRLCDEMRFSIPDCTIFTSHAMISFPFNKWYESGYNQINWHNRTNFTYKSSSLPERSSPFGIFFKTNMVDLELHYDSEFEVVEKNSIRSYVRVFEKIKDNFKIIEPFFIKLNNLFMEEFPSEPKLML